MATVDTAQRLRHVIQFVDEATPTKRAKPAGVMDAEIWVKLGDAPPADAAECTFLALDTATPYLAEYPGAQAGKKAHYILRWVSTRGDHGPWSEVVSATIVGWGTTKKQRNEENMRIINALILTASLGLATCAQAVVSPGDYPLPIPGPGYNGSDASVLATAAEVSTYGCVMTTEGREPLVPIFFGPENSAGATGTVPEPGQWAMMAVTALGIAGYAARRVRAKTNLG